MEEEDASETEKNIYRKYMSSQQQIFNNLNNELMSTHATAMKDLSEDMKAYMFYIYTYLSGPTVGIIKEDAIDTSSGEYQAWKTDEISLRDYLYYGIANGWVCMRNFTPRPGRLRCRRDLGMGMCWTI